MDYALFFVFTIIAYSGAIGHWAFKYWRSEINANLIDYFFKNRSATSAAACATFTGIYTTLQAHTTGWLIPLSETYALLLTGVSFDALLNREARKEQGNAGNPAS